MQVVVRYQARNRFFFRWYSAKQSLIKENRSTLSFYSQHTGHYSVVNELSALFRDEALSIFI